MKNSAVGQHFLPTSLVGLGWANPSELDKLTTEHTFFIIKPIHGCQGRGVRVINKEEVRRYGEEIGPVRTLSTVEFLVSLYSSKKPLQYLEDYVVAGDYSFEQGMAIIQPFIRSPMTIDKQEYYACIRAIICNGLFVDAYARVSPDAIANLSRNAIAQSCSHDSLPQFCEQIISTFLETAQQYDAATFKDKIYDSYFKEKKLVRLREFFATPEIFSIMKQIAASHSDNKK